MRRPWFGATDKDGRNMTSELLSFSEMIGLERAASKRYSLLLLLGLYGGFHSGMLNPVKVVRQIELLESNRTVGMKRATVFKHPPLKGLWHQHYLEDGIPSMARNLGRGLSRFGLPWLEEQIAEAQAAGEERYLSEADVARIAHETVTTNWQRLFDSTALTGEWIIFAKHLDQNYYLCLGTHDSGDDVLRSQIDIVCVEEFPFLKEILPQPIQE